MNHSITKLVSIALIGTVIGKGLRYGQEIIIARALGPEALGLFAFGYVILNLSSVISRLGLDNAGKKYIPIHRRSNNKHALKGTVIFCLLMPFLVGSIVASIVYIGAPFINQLSQFDSADIIRLFAFGIPLFSMMMVGLAATRGFKETKYAVYTRDIVQSGSSVLLIGVIAVTIVNIQAVILAYIISISLGLFVCLIFLNHLGAFPRNVAPQFEARKILIFSLPLLVVSSLQYLISWTDILMLGVFVPAGDIGLYQVSYQTSILLTVLIQASNAIFPVVAADLYHDQQYARLEKIFTVVTKWISYITFLGFIFLVFFRVDILSIFGPEFLAAQFVLLILAGGQVFASATGPAGFLLSMSEYERVEMMNTMFISIHNIVANFLLIQYYGIIGAAIATSFSFILLNCIRLAEVYYLLGIHPFSREYWRGGLALLVSTTVMLIGSLVLGSSLLRLFGVGFIALSIFVITAFVIGLGPDDQILLESIKDKN